MIGDSSLEDLWRSDGQTQFISSVCRNGKRTYPVGTHGLSEVFFFIWSSWYHVSARGMEAVGPAHGRDGTDEKEHWLVLPPPNDETRLRANMCYG